MTQKFRTLSDVIALAEFAHRNQQDKAGMPYIEHPKRVLASVQAQGARPFVQMAAVLHDVTEDTAFTPEMLLELGVPEPAVLLVKLLDRGYSREIYDYWLGTKDAGLGEYVATQSPDEYYYRNIKSNQDARMIKLADIDDNLAQWRQEYLPLETQDRLRKKYANARAMLGWKPPPVELRNYLIGG